MINKIYYLALNRINLVGPRTVMKLLSQWPSLADLFSLSSQAMLEAGLPEKIASAIHQFDLSDIEDDLRWEQSSEQHHLLTWESPNYPQLLKEIHDPPIVLYAKGELNSLSNPCIAMVGSRKPSITGSETAYRIGYELAASQITVVSGLALGIDAQAHKGALAAEGQTVAVMGTGIEQIYPAQHRLLASQISKQGLILSEFPLNSPPSAGHFPRRNRIISGLSLSTLIVEAAIKSGSLITARMALEQNREVMAIPGSIHNPQARGCHLLLQQGANLITSTKDILDALELTGKLGENYKKPQSPLARDNKNLVKCMGFETTTVDQIIIRTGLSIEEVTCNLADLEIQGIVKAVPGGYMRCV